jgi:hypothetical protein
MKIAKNCASIALRDKLAAISLTLIEQARALEKAGLVR